MLKNVCGALVYTIDERLNLNPDNQLDKVYIYLEN